MSDRTRKLSLITAPRELQHFLQLDHGEQLHAIRRLAAEGMSDYSLAAATRLSVEQIRRLLAEQDDCGAQR